MHLPGWRLPGKLKITLSDMGKKRPFVIGIHFRSVIRSLEKAFLFIRMKTEAYQSLHIRAVSFLQCRLADYTASDFFPGISGGLCGKVVGHCMHNHRFPDDFWYGDSFVIKGTPGIALIPEKRNQITGMIWMRFGCPAIVISSFIKGKRTVPVFMNMHGIKICGFGGNNVWKSEKLSFHQCAPVFGKIEFYQTGKPGGVSISCNPGRGGRRIFSHCLNKCRTRRHFFHI